MDLTFESVLYAEFFTDFQFPSTNNNTKCETLNRLDKQIDKYNTLCTSNMNLCIAHES